MAWARKSQTSRTTSLPQPMIREKPIRLPEWMKASVTEPDWAIPTTPPRGSHGLTSPMYVALFVVRSTRPMQLGPSRAIPWRRAISRTSRCIAAAAAPPSTTPPPGTTTARAPAAAASATTAAARRGLTATTTVSGTSGRSARDGWQGWPSSSS